MCFLSRNYIYCYIQQYFNILHEVHTNIINTFPTYRVPVHFLWELFLIYLTPEEIFTILLIKRE